MKTRTGSVSSRDSLHFENLVNGKLYVGLSTIFNNFTPEAADSFVLCFYKL